MDKKEKELLSAKSDLIFKIIFGDPKNKDILASFLQAVTGLSDAECEDLTIMNPHLNLDAPDDKLGILDIKLKTKLGTIIDIEIQVFNTREMKERILFYTSKMIVEQVGKAERYGKIEKVISIVITDFILSPDKIEYHGCYHFNDDNTQHCFSDKMEINVLELPKLPENTDSSELYAWMKFFQTKDRRELKMLGKENEAIAKAYNILEEISADEQTRLVNEAREKARRDEISRLGSARDEGLEQGIEQGVYQEKIEVAKKLFATNVDITIISEVTELSIPELEEIKNKE